MPRRNPPTCADCGRPILWAHAGPKDEFGTRWIRLDPGDREPAECVKSIPFETGMALHHCHKPRELVRDFARAMCGVLWCAAREHIFKPQF